MRFSDSAQPYAPVTVCLMLHLLTAGAAPACFGDEPNRSGDARSAYILGPGDRLDIRIYGRPQLDRDGVRIEGDGSIRIPLLDEPVRIACRTESEAAAEISLRYRKFLVDPQITVAVKEFSSQPVELVGAIHRPGLFQLQRRVRLRELLTLAGGVKPDAGRSIQVIRDESYPVCGDRVRLKEGGATEPVNMAWFDVAGVMSGAEALNPYVLPGDYVNVPEAGHIFVVGNVAKPVSLPLTAELTITRAIAQAGGALPASKRNARVLRSTEKGMNKEFSVDLRAIAVGTSPDVALQAGDIVEVQVSQGRQFLKTAVAAVASIGPYYPLLVLR
jgi:polysaccharide export outer membrane protein